MSERRRMRVSKVSERVRSVRPLVRVDQSENIKGGWLPKVELKTHVPFRKLMSLL